MRSLNKGVSYLGIPVVGFLLYMDFSLENIFWTFFWKFKWTEPTRKIPNPTRTQNNRPSKNVEIDPSGNDKIYSANTIRPAVPGLSSDKNGLPHSVQDFNTNFGNFSMIMNPNISFIHLFIHSICHVVFTLNVKFNAVIWKYSKYELKCAWR